MGIYTKKGDKGKTSLLGSVDKMKSDEIFDVLGTLDELNASLGFIYKSRVKGIKNSIEEIQGDLFYIGGILANSNSAALDYKDIDSSTTSLESKIDSIEKKLPKLKNFILPRGTESAVRMHLSRAICRRLEREFVRYLSKSSNDRELEYVLKYLNRLSDYLFVLARYVNFNTGVKETIWKGK